MTSAVVWIRNAPPPKDRRVAFTYKGAMAAPALSREIAVEELEREPKWTRYPQAARARRNGGATLGDLFEVKRGLVTGDNGFFIMKRARIAELGLPMECFRPVLPGARHIPENEIAADETGLPQLENQLFLLDVKLAEAEIAARFPALAAYLKTGKQGENPVAQCYLCRSRKPWYAQENRPAAPIVCTYMGRSRNGARPFRFILNHSAATACNVFLMLYPRPKLAQLAGADPEILRTVWNFLNGIAPEDLLDLGRVYGGGLHKLEPKELRGLPVAELVASFPDLARCAASVSTGQDPTLPF